MQPVWRGSISFGLVSVPVRLFTAVRSHTVRFRQINPATGAPVRQKRVDAETGEEVAYQDIAKGYEVGDGQFLVVEPAELEGLKPEASPLIEIHDYVEQADIDPIYYDRAYYLAPDGEVAAKPYRLLTAAMQRTAKVGIATFVMRDRQYLAALRARDELLLLSTMHYADEVADPEQLDVDLGRGAVLSERDVSMAEELITSLSTTFDPQAYRDDHHDRLIEFLEAKAEGETFELPEPRHDAGNVIDLTAALEQSLDRLHDGRGERTRDYEQMTRNELYQLAKQRDIPGRSSLSKEELIAALHAGDRKPGAA